MKYNVECVDDWKQENNEAVKVGDTGESNDAGKSNKNGMSEEERVRMEANRLRAVERAAARRAAKAAAAS